MYVAKTKALINWAIANAKGRFSLDMAQNEPSSVLVISIYQPRHRSAAAVGFRCLDCIIFLVSISRVGSL